MFTLIASRDCLEKPVGLCVFLSLRLCASLQAQSLASSLSTRQLLRICRRLSQHPEETVAHAVNKACLSRWPFSLSSHGGLLCCSFHLTPLKITFILSLLFPVLSYDLKVRFLRWVTDPMLCVCQVPAQPGSFGLTEEPGQLFYRGRAGPWQHTKPGP